jgi:hypothetical protein
MMGRIAGYAAGGFLLGAVVAGCQHPGYFSAGEPCKGPNLTVVQDPAADGGDQQFTVTGVGAVQPGGGPQRCRLHGRLTLTLTDLTGDKQFAHLQVPFDATVGGGAAPMVVRVAWSNWCASDHHGALAYQFETDDSSSGGSRALTDFPGCRSPASPTTLRRR